MNKNEFAYWIEWIKVRWPNSKIDATKMQSLYLDFSNFSDEIFGQAVLEQYDGGEEFFSFPTIKKRCKQLYIDEIQDKLHKKALASKSEEAKADKPSSLRAYLAMEGWKTLEEAVFYTTVRLYREKKLLDWQYADFKRFTKMSFKEAKDVGWRFGLQTGLE